MTHLPTARLALLGVAASICLLTAPAHAASSAASSASDSLTTSSGSLSASVNKSSNSSHDDDKVSQGDYSILDMAQAPKQPGKVVLQLQAVAIAGPAGALTLTLPEAAVTGAYLRVGHVVTVQDRPYGIEFASALTHQAFFLALNDAWTQDLKTSVVRL